MPPAKRPADFSAASKERNEYIPSYISKKPFYVDDESSTTDYLEHQRLQKSSADAAKWYDRGKRLGPAATKFRKGACENCGSMTHKTKECLSRPRKQGAKWTGRDIQADEVVQDVELGWDAKRDRWNGYDAADYTAVVDEYSEMEELRKHAKATGNLDGSGPMEDGDEDDEAEEAKYAEESDMGRQQSKATRNLRLREDTAKYLLNLDLDSAKYDPKTRSMVDSGATADRAAALVAEENFMRASGDAAEFERAQRYAWESQERGDKNKQHLQANPTSGEFFRRKEKEQTESRQQVQREGLLEKYGEQQPRPASLRDAALAESERYVEYDEKGLVKGAPKVSVKSKYAEDIFINNHMSVWGSWWSDFKWGYACCHSTVKNSYCTGEEGKLAYEEATHFSTGGLLEGPDQHMTATDGDPTNSDRATEAAETPRNDDRSRDSTGMAKKRTLQEMKGGVTEEEMEAYRRKRTVADDPMAAFIGKEELVH
ncbi:MAG: mRNA splicing protein [Phylliscum demangeonii]|nr:MAG: mRNA splicing protein [Phylliscum demangeonii]